MESWKKYVPVGERIAKGKRKANKLRKQGLDIQPVEVEGRNIARSFWGKGWCDHLESFSDYENRLPRGRTYVRNRSVCHLDIQPGHINALVAGSELYTVTISIKELKPALWKALKSRCAGHIGTMLELLQGKLSEQVMAIVSDRKQGLFPQPGEIELSCSCPDWAVMCKHVAAALYGVGNRLDHRPELLFLLRGVDAEELIEEEIILPGASTNDSLAADQLGDIFGIDFELDVQSAALSSAAKSRSVRVSQKAGRQKKAAPASTPRRTKAEKGPSGLPGIRLTGKSIARMRKQLDFSADQFAQLLDVSGANVNRWEATPGALALDTQTLVSLAALQQILKAGQ